MDSIELVGKRCPNGYTINKKTGRCNKKTVKISEIYVSSPQSIELVGKRCPNGYIKNKKTGKCKKKQQVKENKEMAEISPVPMPSLDMEFLQNKETAYEKEELQGNLGSLQWEINNVDAYIFGYNNFSKRLNVKNVYLFDLDFTLIQTVSKKKFPTNKDDWKLLYENIPEKIASLDKSLVGIVSNQKGLKTDTDRADFIEKMENISKVIRIDFVFAALEDNRYRKPMCGSLEFFKSHYSQIKWDNVSYIGDAAGRKRDHSDTDYKYAINCGMQFFTPEMFFGGENQATEQPTITYPEIQYMSKTEEISMFKKIDDAINSHPKIIILMVGFPASGKSYVRNKIMEKYADFVYTNNDDIKSKVKNNRLIKNITSSHNGKIPAFIIDDNTNLRERGDKLKGFDDYYKIGIWFNYEMDVCFHLNYVRMYANRGKLMPKIVYYTLNKKYDRNVVGDGVFDEVVEIDKLFGVFKHDEIKYYF